MFISPSKSSSKLLTRINKTYLDKTLNNLSRLELTKRKTVFSSRKRTKPKIFKMTSKNKSKNNKSIKMIAQVVNKSNNLEVKVTKAKKRNK